MTEEEARTAKLIQHGTVFCQLLESQRFRELMDLYFTFQQEVDEETKTISMTVIENPPEVIAQKMGGQAQKDQSEIKIVTGSQAQAVVEQAKRIGNNAGGRRHKDPKRR